MFHENFTVTPRIFRTGETTVFSGKFLYSPRNPKMGHPFEYKLKYITGNGIWEDGKVHTWDDEREYPCQFNADGTFSFSFTSRDEGEVTFKIEMYLPETNRKIVLGQFGCYALEEDLYDLRPFKGDTHVHTSWSECGRIEEEPARVAAVGREKGLDFIFITDHSKQYPSREAIAALQGFENAYQVYPGEETHLLKRHNEDGFLFQNDYVYQSIHLLSLGASASVVEYANTHYEEYERDIVRRMQELPAEFSEDERRLMAGSDWILDKTREFGGVSVYAHPFWQPNSRLNLPPAVREYIFRNGKFDAVEVFGLGSSVNAPACYAGNVECAAWLQEKAIEYGKRFSVTGATDTHEAPLLLGTQCTIAFAKANTLEDIKQAICNGKTTAFRRRGNEHPVFWGEFRLVRYAGYLYREFFPEHDEFCAIEGKLMQQALRGEIPPELVNAYSQKRIEQLYRRYWKGK